MYKKHKFYWSNKNFNYNILIGLFFLGVAFFTNFYANSYLTKIVGTQTKDIILDNLPVIDVHLIFSEGALLFIFVLLGMLLYEPKFMPFTLKSIAIFFIIRSFFLILTHMAPPAQEIFINRSDYFTRLSSGFDLFFSAHTGLPFLLAFIFWDKKASRYFFITCSIIGGITVLLGHIHYSIDVFSALFISFGIFHICKNIFKKDFELIKTQITS